MYATIVTKFTKTVKLHKILGLWHTSLSFIHNYSRFISLKVISMVVYQMLRLFPDLQVKLMHAM